MPPGGGTVFTTTYKVPVEKANKRLSEDKRAPGSEKPDESSGGVDTQSIPDTSPPTKALGAQRPITSGVFTGANFPSLPWNGPIDERLQEVYQEGRTSDDAIPLPVLDQTTINEQRSSPIIVSPPKVPKVKASSSAMAESGCVHRFDPADLSSLDEHEGHYVMFSGRSSVFVPDSWVEAPTLLTCVLLVPMNEEEDELLLVGDLEKDIYAQSLRPFLEESFREPYGGEVALVTLTTSTGEKLYLVGVKIGDGAGTKAEKDGGRVGNGNSANRKDIRAQRPSALALGSWLVGAELLREGYHLFSQLTITSYDLIHLFLDRLIS